jgi:hypothetical protein
MAPYKASLGKPVHQFHRAMMLNLQALSDFGDARTTPRRQSLQRQHELVLSRFQANTSHILFTEVEEAANLMPQLCQGLVIREIKASIHRTTIAEL